MRILHFLSAYVLFIVLNCLYLVNSRSPSHVQVTLRGKKYQVRNAGTVGDLQSCVEEQSGVSTASQGRVLFAGKHLKPSDKLEDIGIKDGSIVNVVPDKFVTKRKSSNSRGPKKYTKRIASDENSIPITKSGNKLEKFREGSNQCTTRSRENPVENLLEKVGMDSSKLEEFKKKNPLRSNSDIPDLEQTAEYMQSMMNNPLFQTYMNDPVKIEQGRQLILRNPIVNEMINNLPGFDEVLNDPVKWRQTMIAGINMYKNMGTNLKSAISSLDPDILGLGNSWGELGSGSNTALGKSSALDELSEGDD